MGQEGTFSLEGSSDVSECLYVGSAAVGFDDVHIYEHLGDREIEMRHAFEIWDKVMYQGQTLWMCKKWTST